MGNRISPPHGGGRVGLLGCGWLGLPLARELIKADFSVKGSTTTPGKLEILTSEGIDPFLISVSEKGIKGELDEFLKNSEILIIDFPPGLRKNPQQNYAGAIENLIQEINKHEIKKVIFISSIAVFEEKENFPEYSEEDKPNATSASGQQLISAENQFLNNPNFEAVVIRFGGLLGAGRHPVKYLSGRKGIKNAGAPVNLIQLEDCIRIIAKIIEKDKFKGIFHGVYPSHPKKEEFYSEAALKFNIPAPEFVDENGSLGKLISSGRLEEDLDYCFVEDIR